MRRSGAAFLALCFIIGCAEELPDPDSGSADAPIVRLAMRCPLRADESHGLMWSPPGYTVMVGVCIGDKQYELLAPEVPDCTGPMLLRLRRERGPFHTIHGIVVEDTAIGIRSWVCL